MHAAAAAEAIKIVILQLVLLHMHMHAYICWAAREIAKNDSSANLRIRSPSYRPRGVAVVNLAIALLDPLPADVCLH